MKQDNSNEILNDVTTNDYKYGFVTDIETDIIPTGLNEDIIRHISEKKKEPEWLLEFRLKAYAYWKTLEMPHWAHLNIPDIDYQAISYYAAPKTKEAPKSLDEVDPEHTWAASPVKKPVIIALSIKTGKYATTLIECVITMAAKICPILWAAAPHMLISTRNFFLRSALIRLMTSQHRVPRP